MHICIAFVIDLMPIFVNTNNTGVLSTVALNIFQHSLLPSLSLYALTFFCFVEIYKLSEIVLVNCHLID